MKLKAVSGITLTLLLIGMSMLVFNIQPVKTEPSPQPPLGIISYWKFDDGSGTMASDFVGENDGTIYGATWNTGIVGGALSFDGADDYVSIPDSNSFRFSGNGTLELWIKQSGNMGTLLWKRIYSNSSGWALYFQCPNQVIGYVNDWLRDWVGTTVSLDEWQHIALVYEAGLIMIYVNGVLRDTESNPIGFQPTNVNLYIGRDEIGDYFNGLIDEVAIYSRSLSASEILEHYQNGLMGLGYYVVEPRTWTVDDDGPADFSTIQEAINHANQGDTIYVKAGTYYENVVVNKTVSLVGENRNSIIDGNGTGTVVVVTTGNINITGFTIQNSGRIVDQWPPDSGIFIEEYSDGNIVCNNTISNNGFGIYLDGSGGNTIYHNNFINSEFQAGAYESYGNVWDSGYPSGGNYWSDHNGIDFYSGPHQNVTGGDGIGDTPYIIDKYNQDNYPLMEPLSPPPSISGDVNNDGIVDIYDAVLCAKAFGSKPNDLHWNPDADFNNDSIVDILDLVIIAINFARDP